MKKILYTGLLLAIMPLFFTQCDSTDDLVTENATVGGLVELTSPNLNYVVGNTSPYSFSFFVYQGTEKISKVYFYKSYYSVADTLWSNEVLESTYTITNPLNHYVTSDGYYYADLIEGLTVDGNAISSSDGDLSIGDMFMFRIVTELEDGTQQQIAGKELLTVSTRYAGKYKFIAGEYYRIGVPYPSTYWTGTQDFWEVKSIDAKTYLFQGVAAWPLEKFYFQIEDDGTISYPLEWDGAAQIINGAPLITCFDNPTDMTFVHCGTSNYVLKDDVAGKDRLYMSFGYYTAGSGSREFYQVMEKIVE